jgi:hypothetical protein
LTNIWDTEATQASQITHTSADGKELDMDADLEKVLKQIILFKDGAEAKSAFDDAVSRHKVDTAMDWWRIDLESKREDMENAIKAWQSSATTGVLPS